MKVEVKTEKRRFFKRFFEVGTSQHFGEIFSEIWVCEVCRVCSCVLCSALRYEGIDDISIFDTLPVLNAVRLYMNRF